MTLEEFEVLLKQHDWTYMMSDDHRVFTKGNRKAAAIDNWVGKIEGAEELHTKYYNRAWGK